ncbi:MAG: response regulator transcription factor [Gammaproteobacteria bacterium]|nr:response regulator transcription factor [Gammaproteobacteria bacterium]
MSCRRLVFVVDDDASFRTAVTRMLTAAGLTVQTFPSASALLAHLRTEQTEQTEQMDSPGCVLADLCMPGLDGLQLQEACAGSGVELPFVFLTGQGDVKSAVSAMRHGAIDFLDKCAPQHDLLAALERALERDARARAARARRAQLEQRFSALTERENEVLAQVVHGRMNKQIAAALGIHERTVKLHRSAITTKLGVRSVAELTSLTRQIGRFEEPQQSCP